MISVVHRKGGGCAGVEAADRLVDPTDIGDGAALRDSVNVEVWALADRREHRETGA